MILNESIIYSNKSLSELSFNQNKCFLPYPIDLALRNEIINDEFER
jgi:hypothetical protein